MLGTCSFSQEDCRSWLLAWLIYFHQSDASSRNTKFIHPLTSFYCKLITTFSSFFIKSLPLPRHLTSTSLYFHHICASQPPWGNCTIECDIRSQQQHKHIHRLTWMRPSASRPKGQLGPWHLRGELMAASQTQLDCTWHESDCGRFAPPSILVIRALAQSGDYVASDEQYSGGTGWRGTARRSAGVKVTWLFKKWQRELLIPRTRTERAAAVTSNGIIDGLSGATTGFEAPVWAQELDTAAPRCGIWTFNRCHPHSGTNGFCVD